MNPGGGPGGGESPVIADIARHRRDRKPEVQAANEPERGSSETHMKKKFIAVIVLLNFLAVQVFAWGPKGHAIVADIASSRLTPQAKEKLQDLLGGGSLASIASWADDVRKEHDESYGWHFVDIPKDAAGFDDARDCFRPQDKHKNADTDHHNCVVDRIEIFKAKLADESLPREQRVEALKWLVHFVGDLQQPLHAVEEARGGNDIKLPVFGSPKCGDYDCNLHWTWDTLLLEHAGLSEEQYVSRLEALIAKENLQAKAGGTAVDWANESHEQAKRLLENKPAAVDEAYFQANIGLVDEKLALGGLRLAKVLNEALGR